MKKLIAAVLVLCLLILAGCGPRLPGTNRSSSVPQEETPAIEAADGDEPVQWYDYDEGLILENLRYAMSYCGISHELMEVLLEPGMDVTRLYLEEELSTINGGLPQSMTLELELPDISAMDAPVAEEEPEDGAKIQFLAAELKTESLTFSYALDYTLRNGRVFWDLEDIEELIEIMEGMVASYFDRLIIPQPEPDPVPESGSGASSPSQATPTPQTPTVPELQELPYPSTGVLTSNDSSDFGPLRFKTSSGNPTYIKIYTTGGALVKTLFINAGQTYTTNMPAGSFVVNYCSGSKWYGEEEMFGPNGVYQRADTVLNYVTAGNGFEITLEMVYDGNLDSVPVPRGSF